MIVMADHKRVHVSVTRHTIQEQERRPPPGSRSSTGYALLNQQCHLRGMGHQQRIRTQAWGLLCLLPLSSLLPIVITQVPPSARPGSTFATNANTGPFTFDGFEFGFGGINVNDPNLLSRALVQTAFNRLFNNPFLAFLVQGVPNQVRRPSDFLPLYLRNTVQRDVTQLYGYDLLDRYLALFYSLPTSNAGAIRPAGCIGPIFALNVNGGNCTVSPTTGAVTCSLPTLTLTVSSLTCSGFWRQGCAFAGSTVRTNIPLSPLRGGYLSARPGVYDFGTAVNLTRVLLGFNVNSRRVLNDFGVTRFYFYLVAFLGFLLLRAARALITTPLPTLLQAASLNVTGQRPVPFGGPGFRSAYSDLVGDGTLGNSTGEDPLGKMMDQLLRSATSQLTVDRRAMPGANALYQDPDSTINTLTKKLQGAGLGALSGLLKGGSPQDSSSAGSRYNNPSNRITNSELGQPKFGTFDAQGAYNPSKPVSEGDSADTLTNLLWRKTAGKNATSDDVLYQQLGQQMRRLLPWQTETLDTLAAQGQQGLVQDQVAGLLGNPSYGYSLSDLFDASPPAQPQTGSQQSAAPGAS